MSEPELEMSTRAYCKLIMHSAKYPSCALNGVLLAKREDLRPGSRLIKYTDCIPLFHLGMGLTPMLEVALTQVRCPLSSDLFLSCKRISRSFTLARRL
jgi:hypothetical protein